MLSAERTVLVRKPGPGPWDPQRKNRLNIIKGLFLGEVSPPESINVNAVVQDLSDFFIRYVYQQNFRF